MQEGTWIEGIVHQLIDKGRFYAVCIGANGAKEDDWFTCWKRDQISKINVNDKVRFQIQVKKAGNEQFKNITKIEKLEEESAAKPLPVTSTIGENIEIVTENVDKTNRIFRCVALEAAARIGKNQDEVLHIADTFFWWLKRD